MDCHNVQKMLSSYIEGIISHEESKLIDEHLSACSKCKEALYDLKKTLEYVQNLEDVEPPEWLTQTVMTRIRSETEPRKGILQKLFYPLYIKLPIEAVAVVLIAVTALYIFKTIQPEIKPAKAPSEHEVVIARSPESFRDDKAIPKEKIASPLARNDKNELISTKVPKAPSPVAKHVEINPSTGALAKEEARPEALGRAPKAKSLAETKEEILSFTIHVRDVDNAIKEIEESLMQHGAEIVKIEHQDEKDMITAKIDSKKLKQFISKLKDIGEVKEKDMDLGSMEGYIEIRIEIVRK